LLEIELMLATKTERTGPTKETGLCPWTPECSYWYWGMNSNRMPTAPA